MAEMFTSSQKEAIEYRDGSVIVSAGAGSGKTSVLTSRLMKYITDDNADIDKFVIITFTQAAASELKARISNALHERGMQRQEALLERAHIGTIHHFCSEILRENAHAVHINPDFRIVSDERAAEMRSAALDKVLDQRYKNIAEDYLFEELVNSIGKGRTDESLVNLILELHSKMQCHPDPVQWAEKIISELKLETDDAGKTIWGDEILKNSAIIADSWVKTLDDLMVEMSSDEQIAKAYLPSLSETADGFREYSRTLRLGWDRAVNAPDIQYPRLGTIRNAEDPFLQEKVKAVRKLSKSAYEKLRKNICVPSNCLLDDMKETSACMETLLKLVLDFDEAYSKDKRRLNYLDYNDLEHMASSFLSNHDISDRYIEIMVDEYQDVSRVQDYIFYKVSGNGKKLFMVGDLKQSIYRFRLADPDIFKEKCTDDSVHKIFLRENFRSGSHIISSINSVFKKIMTDNLGDTDYSKNALICGLKDINDKSKDAKVILVNSNVNESKSMTEASAVADMIIRLNEEESIKFEDMAVLLRSFGKTGDDFMRVFIRRGIPVNVGQSGNFFESAEISAMLSILRIMDNPHNDIPLIAALRFAFFGFTPDDLSEIRVCDKGSDFFTALCEHAKFNEKSADFLKELAKLRELAPDLSTDSMIRLIINETEAETICSLMTDGERRMANLMQLVSLGVKFENDGYHGLHRFIMYLDRLREKNADISSSQEENAVQMMSIHKSKGLEFKVVFVCDLEHQFNKSDVLDNVLIHPELGLGPKVTDKLRKVQYPTLARNAIAIRLEREMHSEEMRLMYVALTRAKEQLYLTACVDKPDEVVQKAEYSSMPDAICPLTWILSAGALEVSIVDAPNIKPENAIPLLVNNEKKNNGKLLSNFEHKYNYLESLNIPSKVNATELKHFEANDIESEALIKQSAPRKIHLTGNSISAAERGSATHKVLQLIDFSKDVDSEVNRLVHQKYISSRQALAVDTSVIKSFLNSDIGKFISQSGNVRREFEFILLYNAQDIIGRGGYEKVLLRGVVDCCVEEDDGLIIIDYKTDRIRSSEEIHGKAKEYTPQLNIYAKSLERIFGKPVKDKILYFLSVGEAVYLK